METYFQITKGATYMVHCNSIHMLTIPAEVILREKVMNIYKMY